MKEGEEKSSDVEYKETIKGAIAVRTSIDDLIEGLDLIRGCKMVPSCRDVGFSDQLRIEPPGADVESGTVNV